ncbi:MAG TPA: hypothetical protein VFF33_04525 [Ignavibacteriaceae bacterium]|nr:hypothetical protein [Ignavibacteriaceae bacterium]
MSSFTYRDLIRLTIAAKELASEKINHYREHPLDYFEERLSIKKETINWSLHPEYKSTLGMELRTLLLKWLMHW